MVKRDIRDYLNDILIHIDLAEEFIDNMTLDEFKEDPKTILALCELSKLWERPLRIFHHLLGRKIQRFLGRVLRA